MIEEKKLKNEDGRYDNVSTFEEAKRVMQDYSPQKTEFLKKANLEKAFIGGICGIGVTGAVVGLVGLPLTVLFPAAAVPVAAFAIKAACDTAKAKKKNQAIESGEYFEGKKEADVISEANYDYVRHNNFMKGWEEQTGRTMIEENGRSR